MQMSLMRCPLPIKICCGLWACVCCCEAACANLRGAGWVRLLGPTLLPTVSCLPVQAGRLFGYSRARGVCSWHLGFLFGKAKTWQQFVPSTSRAHGVVASHPLRMRKALGSNPSGSILLCLLACWPELVKLDLLGALEAVPVEGRRRCASASRKTEQRPAAHA